MMHERVRRLASFTVIDVPVVDRAWLNDLATGTGSTENAPGAWRDWVHLGRYKALTSESTTVSRTQQAQTPDNSCQSRHSQDCLEPLQGGPSRVRGLCCADFSDARPTGHRR